VGAEAVRSRADRYHPGGVNAAWVDALPSQTRLSRTISPRASQPSIKGQPGRGAGHELGPKPFMDLGSQLEALFTSTRAHRFEPNCPLRLMVTPACDLTR